MGIVGHVLNFRGHRDLGLAGSQAVRGVEKSDSERTTIQKMAVSACAWSTAKGVAVTREERIQLRRYDNEGVTMALL